MAKEPELISAFQAYKKNAGSKTNKHGKTKVFKKPNNINKKSQNKVIKIKLNNKNPKHLKEVSKKVLKSNKKSNMKTKQIKSPDTNENSVVNKEPISSVFLNHKEISNLSDKLKRHESNIESNSNLKPLSEKIISLSNGNIKRKRKLKEKNKKNTKSAAKCLNGSKNENNGKHDICESSFKKGEKLLSSIISPIPISKFFKDIWERHPVHIKRNKDDYFTHLISMHEIDLLFRNNNLFYSRNVDIVSYGPNGRETHNPEGRVHSAVVWDYYSNGCSVRLLNPQTYIPKLQSVMSLLQEYFECLVGANVYLTPPNSQGFAPHYDDIEAFILQIEGTKHWKLYKPRTESEILPRYSSGNFSQGDLPESPFMEVCLTAGDVLYFPRGTIHQGRTLPDQHSLHITFSVYQKTSWADFFEKLLPIALKEAVENDVEFRKGLPLHYLSHVGLAHSVRAADGERSDFRKKVLELLSKLVTTTDIDKAADQMARQFMHDALPPVLQPDEIERSVFGDGERVDADGSIVNKVSLSSNTEIRLLRKNILRLAKEICDNKEAVLIYHYVDNSKEYHGEELQYLEIDECMFDKVRQLIHSYPDFVSINSLLDGDNDEAVVQLMSDLWERGLLLTEGPLGSDNDVN